MCVLSGFGREYQLLVTSFRYYMQLKKIIEMVSNVHMLQQ